MNYLRIFSKFTCFSTLFLIFVGGMVKSTDSGLAVPDWPLSYGMLFPPMVGGVFYEHGHRMVASFVGFCMLILALWLIVKEERKWVKITGVIALFTVILQGVLGGITVLYYLPTPISVSHGVLAQTFFLLTIFLSYSQSKERKVKSDENLSIWDNVIFIKLLILTIVFVLLQLLIGAIMRHTESGLAIYDFPTMAGKMYPSFSDATILKINDWRFMNGFDIITRDQVIIHFLHRAGAAIVAGGVLLLNFVGFKSYSNNKKILNTIKFLDILLVIQILLGIFTVLTLKNPNITSFHVVIGAAMLGYSFLLLLRVSPNSWRDFKKCISN